MLDLRTQFFLILLGFGPRLLDLRTQTLVSGVHVSTQTLMTGGQFRAQPLVSGGHVSTQPFMPSSQFRAQPLVSGGHVSTQLTVVLSSFRAQNLHRLARRHHLAGIFAHLVAAPDHQYDDSCPDTDGGDHQANDGDDEGNIHERSFSERLSSSY